jgi:hypothetical protein
MLGLEERGRRNFILLTMITTKHASALPTKQGYGDINLRNSPTGKRIEKNS